MIRVSPGQKYGRWTVLEDVTKEYPKSRIKRYRCRCECGQIRDVRRDKLVNGKSTSCGSCRDYGLERILNDKLPKTNTSGVKGVRLSKKTGLYEASVTFRGKYHYLGSYPTLEAAAAARKKAENEIRVQTKIEKENNS